MKIVADFSPKAAEVLKELIAFQTLAYDMIDQTDVYENIGEGRPVSKFIMDTRKELKKLFVPDILVEFPNISDVVGDLDFGNDTAQHILNACTNFRDAERILKEKGFTLLDDADRTEVTNLLYDTIGDIVMFILIRFELYRLYDANTDDMEVMLSIVDYCDKEKITPDVLYGSLLDILKSINRTWYAWEVLSPLHDDLYAEFGGFLGDCQDSKWPLTDEDANELLKGNVDANALAVRYSQESTVNLDDDENDLTLHEYIRSMDLGARKDE